VCWQLSVVLIAPNSSVEKLRAQDSFFNRYVRLFGLGPYWSFFAPEPGPPPIHIEWEVLSASGEVVGTGSLPDSQEPLLFRDRFNRRLTLAAYLLSDRTRVDRVMSRYVCGRHPGAVSVRLWRSFDPIPSLREVAEGKKSLGDPRNRVREWTAQTYCSHG
jgi:hypothetical protein